MEPQPQPFVQPQFVMMPVAQRNGLGVLGFFVALIGLFIPTGIVALMGLSLSLAAIGRAPRGFAAFGVVIGLLGSVFWLLVMGAVVVVGVVAALAAAVVTAGAFVLTQPEVVEVTSDMVNIAISVEEHQRDHDALPDGIEALGLGVAATIDPWGHAYRLAAADDDPGFDVVSRGPDGVFDTDDDVRLSRLDRLWEKAAEGFDQKMEELGRRFEGIDGINYRGHQYRGWGTCTGDKPHYEQIAREQIESERDPGSDR